MYMYSMYVHVQCVYMHVCHFRSWPCSINVYIYSERMHIHESSSSMFHLKPIIIWVCMIGACLCINNVPLWYSSYSLEWIACTYTYVYAWYTDMYVYTTYSRAYKNICVSHWYTYMHVYVHVSIAIRSLEWVSQKMLANVYPFISSMIHVWYTYMYV